MVTPYSFTQPIRYYKANDPYYYEVDNIPLRQLEENILYIKGLLEGVDDDSDTGGYLTTNSELNIHNIKQLRPKSGGGRTIEVNAGRFVSRVNDAFDISKPLNKLVLAGTPSASQIGIPTIEQEWTEANRDEVWSAFVGAAAASTAYNVNGLETWHTFHSTPGTMGSAWATTYGDPHVRMYPHYAGVTPANNKTWPGPSDMGSISPTVWAAGGWAASPEGLPTVHLAFVQMWRGVFRTSVVDFPDSSIEIPAWDDNDFYYRDADGTVVEITANQRIDLLVAYSLPIDSSSTTLNNFETGFCNGDSPTPQTITTPTLGLVRGAGVGIKKNDNTNPLSIDTTEGCDEPVGVAGSPMIAANSSDAIAAANVGIRRVDGSIVHGSFPSPDDLLNLAPALALGVDSGAWGLIGQAALPLAYVVVTKGQATITSDDIIDIRPFLRTTEFTYNERAGVAAANPPLSLANPAVGAWQLQKAIDVSLAIAEAGHTSPTQDGRAIYTDYIMGGLAYGVEGTMLTMCDGPQFDVKDPFGYESRNVNYVDPVNGSSISFVEFADSRSFLNSTDEYLRENFLQYIYTNRQADLKRWLSDPNSSYAQNTYSYLGLPQGETGRNIPLFPEWDMPMDGTNYLNLMGQGTDITDAIPKPTWWMWFESTDSPKRPLVYVPGGVVSDSAHSDGYLANYYGWGSGDEPGAGMVTVCSKKLEISFPSWVNDYDVLVEYVNCGPVTNTGTNSPNDISIGLGSGLSINKGPVVSYPSGAKKAVFQINSNSQSLGDGSETGFTEDGIIQDKLTGENVSQTELTNRPYQWLSYSVTLPQFKNTNFGTSQQIQAENSSMRFTPKFGAAYYPSIKFTIIGYLGSPIEQNTAYNQAANNFTLIQGVQAGNSSQITGDLGPVNGTSKIDIQGT